MTGTDRSPWISTDGDRRSRTSVTVWSLIWVGAFLAADFAIGRDRAGGDVTIIAIVAAVTGVGVRWILAYVSFFKNADELMRKIQLDAMAVALGTGFVSGFALTLLQTAGIVEAHLSHVLVAMAVAYVSVVGVGLRGFAKQ